MHEFVVLNSLNCDHFKVVHDKIKFSFTFTHERRKRSFPLRQLLTLTSTLEGKKYGLMLWLHIKKHNITLIIIIKSE
jgi:hypothetical protein